MRLFVAIEVGADVQRRVADVIDEFKRRLSRSAPRARVSWVAPDRAHITVHFIGEVEADTADRIRAALEPPLAARAFDLTIAGTGVFPARGRPRVLWAGISRGVDQARAVEREVVSRLAPKAGGPVPEAFHPHLTLGRIRQAPGLRTSAVTEGLTGVVFGVVHVSAVTLFESRLTPAGPTYVALGRTSLASPVS